MLSAAFLRGNGVIHRTQKVIQGDDNGHVGRPGEVSLAPPAKTNVIEVSGFSIRVSKETLLTLNVHFCVQFPAQRC